MQQNYRPVSIMMILHDDFGFNQSKIMRVIDCENLQRDRQISLRNPRELDCAGKPVPTFPYPASNGLNRLPRRLLPCCPRFEQNREIPGDLLDTLAQPAYFSGAISTPIC
ncbi:MAG: hypothetical protein ACLQIQ_17775 [Beijerinckiaceae bacterium]